MRPYLFDNICGLIFGSLIAENNDGNSIRGLNRKFGSRRISNFKIRITKAENLNFTKSSLSSTSMLNGGALILENADKNNTSRISVKFWSSLST